jgi:hypothetical protein
MLLFKLEYRGGSMPKAALLEDLSSSPGVLNALVNLSAAEVISVRDDALVLTPFGREFVRKLPK